MHDNHTKIAIVGMGGIFPTCRNLDDFWQLLQTKRTTARPIPPSRSGQPLSHFYRPNNITLDKIISPYACLLDDTLLADTQPAQFGRDPLIALTLAATQQALNDTRSWPDNIDRHTTNTIIGHVLLPTEHSSKLTEQFYFPEKYENNPIEPCNRFSADLPALAIRQQFNLHGDRFCLDAACASTLYALKLARDDLLAARASTVICGGVLRADGLYPQMGFSQLQALSPSGRCLPFTRAADGLVVGEGAGIFVLKRLDTALADGDHIHALLCPVGLSNDTDGNILAPSCEGQLQAMHATYQQSNLSPADIDYIECHATGAPRGDQVEIASLKKLFAPQPNTCTLGTVKGNIGHLLTAAGAAGLAKILLALRHNCIPPNIGANNPTPQLADSPFTFSATPTQWEKEKNKPRRAALSGFGFGGINAHLVIEEYVGEEKSWELHPQTPTKGQRPFEPRVKGRVGAQPQTPQEASPLDPTNFLEKARSKTFSRKKENVRGCTPDTSIEGEESWGHHPQTPTSFLKKARPKTSSKLGEHPPIAVIGIASHCGTLTNVQQLHEKIFADKKFNRHQKHIDTIHAPINRYRLPPAQMLEMLPQQLLMLNTATAAADMAGEIPAATGVFIGLGLDCNTGHFYVRWQQPEDSVQWPALTYGRTLGALGSVVASRIARTLACHSPAFTISSDASSGSKALELACTALHAKEINTAIVGAVDFASHPINIYARGPNLQGNGDAACALVLKPLPAAQRDANTILAILDNTTTKNTHTIGTTDSIATHIGHCGYAHGLLELLYGIMLAAQGENIQVEVQDRDGYTRQVNVQPLTRLARGGCLPLPSSSQPTPLPTTNTTAEKTPQLEMKITPLTIHTRQSYSYQQCLEFARGHAAAVLGEKFAAYDSYPARVRLPDEPLLLCQRILNCTTQEDAKHTLGCGKIQTAHDVREGAWYLDHNTIPLSIAVEAGQADLFLCSQLGIDFINQGDSVYRLLDAQITCAQPLPAPPATIIYDINIERFFQHGNSWFFNFRFTATVNGKLLLQMENGCAGFFTAAQLAAGRGIPAAQRQHQTAAHTKHTATWPLTWQDNATYTTQQLALLREGQLAECFGKPFADLKLTDPCHLPRDRMQLIDRIVSLQAEGGDYGCGLVISELDIKPNAWFLICHFVDDRVMPGTLMYECALQTLRVYTMRRGWVVAAENYRCDAVAGIKTTLKCRGQVTDKNKTLRTEIHLKVSGDSPSPFCIADAYLYVDDKCAVSFTDMSLQHTGLHAAQLQTMWKKHLPSPAKKIFCSNAQILQFAEGDPTRCFGERYAAFSQKRKVARLPRPPYKFLDRITTATPQPAKFTANASCTAEYDLPPDLDYITKEGHLPFCILLEIGLQPCGWLAAYIGCALQSEQDLSFRNLDGCGTQHQPVSRHAGILTTDVRLTSLTHSMGMILCNFALEISVADKKIYTATTGFGFFTKAALAAQTGIRGTQLAELPQQKSFPYPCDLVDNKLKMIDTIDFFDMQGGQQQLGLVRGHKRVDAEEWFFQAHFYQDPVVPGSLGLESLLQLFALLAREQWDMSSVTTLGHAHVWSYRGQVLPTQKQMTTQLEITKIDAQRRILHGDGLLAVDGLVIYRMTDFAVEAHDA